MQLPSRLWLAPINTGFAAGGRPDDRLLQFHEERSGPSIGASIVGNVAASVDTSTNASTVILRDDADAEALRPVASAIQERGSVPGIQLAASPSGLNPRRNWRAASRFDELGRLRQLVSTLEPALIAKQLQSLIQAATLAVGAGFRLVQLHAAHGYLLSLLTSEVLNGRIDRYAHDRLWLEEFASRLRELCGGAILSWRLNALWGLQDAEQEIEGCIRLAQRLDRVGVDMIDLSAGIYTIDRRLIYPGREVDRPLVARALTDICDEVPSVVGVSGRISSPGEFALTPLPNLVISVGRALLADPRFADKWRSGHVASINRCALTNRCHYFSRGKDHLECGVNTNLGKYRYELAN